MIGNHKNCEFTNNIFLCNQINENVAQEVFFSLSYIYEHQENFDAGRFPGKTASKMATASHMTHFRFGY
jgi:hypothetical protein